MKIRKVLFSTLLSLAVSFSAFAQNPGADYISLGELKLAKEYFIKRMRQAPAEANYYLGEIAYKEGNMAEAKANYEKGLAANPESALSAIGLAKLELKSNPKAANDQLSTILKKHKKDVEIILAVAKAYFDNGMQEEGQKRLADARKANKKSPLIYVLEGDLIGKSNPGSAAEKYEQAIYFDSQCTIAYMKEALMYEGINNNTSIDLLKKAVEIQPDYKISYKYLGRIYTQNGFYPDAIEAYKIYFEGGDYSLEDIKHYITANYFTQQYDAANELLAKGLAMEPNDFILNRLSMYTKNELKDYAGALSAAQNFFNIPLPKDVKYLDRDYMAYGNILSESGKKLEAIEQFKKAIELDPTKIELNKEISSILANEDMNAEAAEFYAKYIDAKGEAADATDFNQLARLYNYAGAALIAKTGDEAAKAKGIEYLKEADKNFGIVSERVPDSYLGYYQRAQVNARMDPDTEHGLAKPHYEKTIEVLLSKEDPNTRVLEEAYQYLSYYYYLQFDKSKKAEDKAHVKEYSQKVLEINPENPNGKALFEFANAK